ncbi:hypothetical protein HYALB_00012195 [Hymenoscyphus albidus]|uniref:Rhodopsin domain-containing protein n=1 Tax=Hymenoscyphus albidus TaxID=595503 RepID=A0A9N9LL93_9HELO|nr:hypothetical protein HYALB_00012195 [Hymenoscyphus albidus]
MSTEQKTVIMKMSLANQLLYNPILTLVKASVILFLLRIGGTKSYVKKSLYVIFFINAGLVIAIFVADAFQCTPFHYVYDASCMDLEAQRVAGADSNGMVDGKLIKGGKCFNQRLFFLFSAGFAVGTDLAVIAIPTLIVWNLKMTKRRKIAAVCVLSTGVLVTGVSILRLVLYYGRFDPRNHDTTHNVDYTTSSMEANLSIAAACITSLVPLMKRFLPRILGSNDASSAYEPSTEGFQKSDQGGQFPLKAVSGKLETCRRGKSYKSQGDSVLDGWNSEEAIVDNDILKTINVDISFDAKSSRKQAQRYKYMDSF